MAEPEKLEPEALKSEYVFKVLCAVEGHEDDWIAFDTEKWGLAEYRHLYGGARMQEGLIRYVERDSVAWRITGDEGLVPHPGRGAPQLAWEAAYRQMGEAGLVMREWLCMSPMDALEQRATLTKKRDRSGSGSGKRK